MSQTIFIEEDAADGLVTVSALARRFKVAPEVVREARARGLDRRKRAR